MLLVLCAACGSSGGAAGGNGGDQGVGGAGGAQCDVAAANACLDLQSCCEAILINPVFFQSCNSVVLQCDEAACRALLEGYVRCRDIDL
jgi:hypothetical protein